VGVEELLTGRPPDLEARLELRLQEARHALSDGWLEEGRTGLQAAAREARRYGLEALRARAEEGLGLAFERAGRPEEALAHYERAEAIARDGSPAAAV